MHSYSIELLKSERGDRNSEKYAVVICESPCVYTVHMFLSKYFYIDNCRVGGRYF